MKEGEREQGWRLSGSKLPEPRTSRIQQRLSPPRTCAAVIPGTLCTLYIVTSHYYS